MRTDLPTIQKLEGRLLLAAQAYDWKSVTIKGNGYIDGIVYGPSNDIAYIHTDMGGAYRLDPATNRWSPLTDWITANDQIRWNGAQTMATDPTDPNRVYLVAGTYQSNAAFLRSTDQGRTWQRTDVSAIKVDANGWGRNVGERLMVDPNKPSNLWYGAQYYSAAASGLWKSTDFGATWTQQNFPFLGDIWNGAYANSNGVGLPFVLFDKTSGTPGNASQTMYAGVSTSTSVSNKIYRTLNGGATWQPIPNQPTTTLTPNRAVLTPDGSAMYIAYSDQAGPYAASSGALYKVTNPSSASPTWTLVTPSAGAYSAITLDPTNPNTVYTAVFDRYPDNIYRSTNGGVNWIALNPQNNLDNTSAKYASSLSTHWLTDLEIDPTNNNVAMYVTGYGIFRTTNLTSSNPKWAFFDDGFEQSAAAEIVSPPNGPVNLLTAIGDRDGYRHDDFNSSPPLGRFGQNNNNMEGSNDDIDVAWSDANYLVRTFNASPWAQYSNDNGVTWLNFSTINTAGNTNGGNLIALSADGLYAAYEPGDTNRIRYAVRTGSTWGTWTTPAANRPNDGANPVADLVESHTFYAYAGTTVWMSTDGGANWTVQSASAPSGASWIRAVPGNAGHLLMSRGSNGLWRSTNHGASWSRINSAQVTVADHVGLGAAAPGQTYPAIFIDGTVSGVSGYFRSDDQGNTWSLITDLAHGFGAITVIQGDPRVYGRLYLGMNGRGFLYGDIHSTPASLPAGWSSADINSPGSAGAAGASAGTFDITGGGAGFSGATDQFRYTYSSLTGNGTITAQVVDMTGGSPGNYGAKVGLMFRDGLSANAANAFLAMTPGSVNGAIFQGRASAGASSAIFASQTSGVWAPYWLRLRRAGNQFTAFISPDGNAWTQLGSPQTIAVGSSISVGLAVSAGNNAYLDIAHLTNVSVTTPPTVVAAQQLYNTSPNALSFTFDQDVSHSLVPQSLIVSPGNFTATSVSWDASSKTATFLLPTGSLLDGDYTATLTGTATTNAAGDSVTSDTMLSFWILHADANRDRRVNAFDFNAIASHFGASGATTLDQGDLNYDGRVDTDDFTLLSQQFGVTLPEPTGALAASSAIKPNLFSSRPLNLANEILETGS
jgi:hypothetical protein